MVQNNSKKALLIIDIQEDFTGENAKMPMDKAQSETMIANVNTLIDAYEKLGFTVVYIANAYSKFNILNIFRNFAAIENSNGAVLDNRLKIVSNHYFSKRKANAFSNSQLDIFLKNNQINDLYLCGLMAEACIWQTMKSAIKKSYHVTMITDAIATQSDAKLRSTIQKYERQGAINTLTKNIF
jgi:nicotinamidase/pyrazinamidase